MILRDQTEIKAKACRPNHGSLDRNILHGSGFTLTPQTNPTKCLLITDSYCMTNSNTTAFKVMLGGGSGGGEVTLVVPLCRLLVEYCTITMPIKGAN